MRILYHHRILAADGMQVHVRELTQALIRQGHSIDMVGPRATGEDGKKTATGRLGQLRSILPGAVSELLEVAYNQRAWQQLKQHADRNRPDVIYERYNRFLTAGVRLRDRLNVPLLVEVNAPICDELESLGAQTLTSLARHMEYKVWRAADAILPVSDALADYVRHAGVPEARIHIIPNGVRPELYENIREKPCRENLGLAGKTVFGFVGFVRDWHGLDLVLDVFAQMKDPALHLLIIGDGPAIDGLRAKARNLGIAGQLTFTGVQPHHEIPALLGAVDVALQPDVTPYASPLKLFEYLAAGCAIIAPDRANIREIVADGETALLAKPGNRTALADAIRTLAGDRDLRERLGTAARTLVRQRDFTWDGNARRVEAIAECEIRRRQSPEA